MKINIEFNGSRKDVSFTKPQAKIMQRLLQGERVTFINTHWMSGGQFVWYREDGDYSWGAENVGYRAFGGAMRAISKAFGIREDNLYCKYIIK